MISISTLQSQQIAAMPQGIKTPEASAVSTQQTNQQLVETKQNQQANEIVPPQQTPAQSALTYSYDRDLNGVVIRILANDNTLIKQIPPQEAVKFYKVMAKLIKDQRAKKEA